MKIKSNKSIKDDLRYIPIYFYPLQKEQSPLLHFSTVDQLKKVQSHIGNNWIQFLLKQLMKYLARMFVHPLSHVHILRHRDIVKAFGSTERGA